VSFCSTAFIVESLMYKCMLTATKSILHIDL